MSQITDKVLIVLTNYSRPENMPKIIKAWRDQSISGNKIIVADNRDIQLVDRIKYTNYLCCPNEVDDVWHWTENSGCPCHFYPALSQTRYKYTIFADDDLIPGKNAVQNLLNHAHILNDEFTTIGQVGRTFLLDKLEGSRYSGRNQAARNEMYPVRTDITCRAHLVHTFNLPYVLSFRNELCKYPDPDAERLAHIHDDFLMCISIQQKTGHPSYLITNSKNRDDLLVKEDLDNDNKGAWKRPNHFTERNKMVDLSLALGWRRIDSNK